MALDHDCGLAQAVPVPRLLRGVPPVRLDVVNVQHQPGTWPVALVVDWQQLGTVGGPLLEDAAEARKEEHPLPDNARHQRLPKAAVNVCLHDKSEDRPDLLKPHRVGGQVRKTSAPPLRLPHQRKAGRNNGVLDVVDVVPNLLKLHANHMLPKAQG